MIKLFLDKYHGNVIVILDMYLNSNVILGIYCRNTVFCFVFLPW